MAEMTLPEARRTEVSGPLVHVVRGAQRAGYDVFTDLDSLLAFIGTH